MRVTTPLLWFIALGAAIGGPSAGSAQSPMTLGSPPLNYLADPVPPQFIGGDSELLDRLDAAERRIRDLEIQRLPRVDNGAYSFTSINDDSAIADRLSKLEQAYEKDAAAAAKKKADDAKKPTQKWSGRVHFDYWSFPNESPLANTYEEGDPATDPQDRFLFRRLRFGVAGDVLETMTYKVEMEFANPSSLAFKDAYIGWKELPFFQTVLLGNQKRPYGLDHLNSSRYNVFLERPFVIEAFNQDSRRLGLCAYGVSANEAWNWRYGTFLMQDVQNVGQYQSDAYQVELAGRLANTIWYDESSDGRGYAHWAIAGTVADPTASLGGGPGAPNGSSQARFRTRPEGRTDERWFDTGRISGAGTYELLGLEGAINLGALSIVGEYQNLWLQRSTVAGPDVQFGGGYIYVAYFLTGEHTPWERNSGTLGRVKPFENFFLVDRYSGGTGGGWGAWQVAARYSHGDFTDHDIFGGVGDSVTLGLNWWWTPYSRMQFNYIHGSIAQGKVATNLGDPAVVVFPAGQSGDYDIFGTRFMVDF